MALNGSENDVPLVAMDTSADDEYIGEVEARVSAQRARGNRMSDEGEEAERPAKQEVESATQQQSVTAAARGVCGFLTDVEGNYDYFERYVEISRVLQWTDSRRTQLDLAPGTEFVYGGDTQDKGIGDIRFVKVLLDLKKRYPDRVHIIVGNRDVNKLRLAAELSEEALADDVVLSDTSFPYWVEPAKRVTPAMYLARNADGDQPLENNAVNRLKWMLKETMGADGAFERRRMELKVLTAGQEDVTDEDVVMSYRRSVEAGAGAEGFMLELLREGQVGHVFGRTLFVHGGVTEAAAGAVPGSPDRSDKVQDWVRRLNTWMQEEVMAFEADPRGGKNSQTRAGHGLMDYGVPGGNGGKTVVCAHHLKNGNAEKLSQSVEDYLRLSGINTLITGHQPHGDCPCVIKGEHVLVVSADTSYSEMGHSCWWGVDNRGEAVSEVLVSAEGRVEVHGVLADGRRIEYAVSAGAEQEECDQYVGRQMEDRWWVKAKLQPGTERTLSGNEAVEPQYLLCLGVGFKIETAQLGLRGLKQQLHEDTTVCSFFTDVKGDMDYFARFVELSKVLWWSDDTQSRLELADEAEVVFGGNSQDRGVGERRFVEIILDLKRRYPDKVHLLVGDRDLNKLRLATELSDRAIQDPSTATDTEYPYWLWPDQRVTVQKYLELNGVGADQPLENNAVNRLKWMLDVTMDAPGAFERRRMELASRLGSAEVTDEDVVMSYRRSVEAGAGAEGFMLELVREGQVGHVFGRTLFVHGGVTEAAAGAVPGSPDRSDKVQDWVRRLNTWMQEELDEFEADGGAEVDKKKRAGLRLMDYGVPGGALGQSVVSSSPFQSAPVAVPKSVEDYLVGSGISSVLTGHIPNGDCPAVIRKEDVLVISCDTSLSDPHHESPWGRDHRGKAVSEVLVRRDGRVDVHGRLSDGRYIEYSLADPSQSQQESDDECDRFIGCQLADTSWVKAKLKPTNPREAADPDYQLCFQVVRNSPAGKVWGLETKFLKHSFLSRVQPYQPLSAASPPRQPAPLGISSPSPPPPPQANTDAASRPFDPPTTTNTMDDTTAPGIVRQDAGSSADPQPAIKADCAPCCPCCVAATPDVVNARQEASPATV